MFDPRRPGVPGPAKASASQTVCEGRPPASPAPAVVKVAMPGAIDGANAFVLSVRAYALTDRNRCASGVSAQLPSRLTGVDATAIWHRGFIERVFTGLYSMTHGHGGARDFLEIGDRWSA